MDDAELSATTSPPQMKTPPERSGISFKVGAQLQARDRQKNWYPATIERIDYDKERVLIHYRQWSRRHDEWFQWNSQYLRPLERVSLRRQSLTHPRAAPLFVSGTKVLACWTDCRFYPAKILRVNKDESYTVRFYDGVVRTVKPARVKPFQKSRSEKSAVGSEGWEEGESEEERSGEVEEEKEKEEEKLTLEEKEGAGGRKRKVEPSPSYSPAKKKTDDRKNSGPQNQPTTADSTQPVPPNPARTNLDRDVLLERQAHLPTTHKFSREPLYRVIKNQPPPILSIELDHNPFKCPSVGCSKSFRKASLLHYHIKYYHSNQQLDEQGSEHEPSRRKRLSSEGGDFLSDMKSDNLSRNCHNEQTQHSNMAIELKKDGNRERTEGQDRKDRKNFLRVKLKKKKKKKKSQMGLGSSDDENSDQPIISVKFGHNFTHTQTEADEGSDWSTLTAESGEDTSSWPIATVTEECEVVRCVCEVDEENDFMIQCESCLCWQHGTCMGLYEDNVPHNYICYYCRHTAGRDMRPGWQPLAFSQKMTRNPTAVTGWRRARHYLLEPDWLITGHMFGLSCMKENYSEINATKISHTSTLLAHTHGLHQAVSGLQLKLRLLHSPSHPDLQLWRLPWRREERQKVTSNQIGYTPLCYVSSEHCYQKPGASWEKQSEIRLEDISDKPMDTSADNNTITDMHTQIFSDVKREKHTATGHDKHTLAHTRTRAAEPQCQLNLLEHVESLHHQISSRMDLIERELDVLESWLDHSGELEPPDPLSRLPQLKQRIRRLLRDLCTLRHLSVCR